ncbi:MAG: hypothetical protein GXP27_09775 [Planctomycetes bacterium]|nr:hypothetical protein [Planctomycetota bacterium]
MAKRLRSIIRIAFRLGTVVAGIAALVLVIAWMSGSFHEKIAPGQVPYEYRSAEGVETVPVTLLPMTEYVDAVGTIQPRRKMDIASKVLATILERDHGQSGRPGQKGPTAGAAG